MIGNGTLAIRMSRVVASWMIAAVLLAPAVLPVTYAEEGVGGDAATGTASDQNNATSTNGEGTSSDQTLDQSTTQNGDGSGTASSTQTSTIESNGETTTTQSNSSTSTGATGEAGTPVEGNTSEGSIQTGDAGATTNTVNQVNTTEINSEGDVVIVNQSGNDDVIINEPGANNKGCLSGGPCDTNELTVNTSSSAAVSNEGTASANTGENAIEDFGFCSIDTGKAYAAGNTVNLIDSTFLGTQYLMLVMNQFGDYGGDVVLPGADFFSFLTESNSLDLSTLELAINTTNRVIIDNNVNATAVSGNSTAIANGATTIIHGDAVAVTNVQTIANKTVFNDSSVYLLLKVLGDWTGTIQGLPDGLSWERRSEGVVIFPTNGSTSFDLSTGNGPDSTTITTANTTTVTTTLDVTATTGNNRAEDCGTTLIKTGTAIAVANAVTAANLTVLSRNWVYGLINILGNWSGNLAFGRPDLWTAQRATFSFSPMHKGDTASFTLDVKNFGNATANNVRLNYQFNRPGLLSIMDAGGGFVGTSDIFWDIGTLAPGEGTSVTFSAQAVSGLPVGIALQKGLVKVTASEHDGDLTNNQDALSFGMEGPATGGGGSGSNGGGGGGGVVAGVAIANAAEVGDGLPSPGLRKSHDDADGVIKPGTTVKYEVVLRNDGPGSIYNGRLTDRLYDPYGVLVDSKSWLLPKTFLPGKQLTTTYDVNFKSTTPGGKYTNKVFLSGTDQYGKPVQFIEASATVVVDAPPEFPAWYSQQQAQQAAAAAAKKKTTATVRRAATTTTLAKVDAEAPVEEALAEPLALLPEVAEAQDMSLPAEEPEQSRLPIPVAGGLGLVLVIVLVGLGVKLWGVGA